MWSRVENGPNAYKFGPRNISEMKIKDTMPEVLDKEGNKLYIMKQEPVFIQRKGKLTILRASPASQGVYFCYDAQSRSHTSIFYVLMAMTPPVRMSEMKDVLEELPNEYKWMPKLNALFNHEPFRSKGIRLYSSLLASLFVNEEIMLQCHYEKRRLETDQIWRMLLRSMGASYKEGPLKGNIAELDEDGKYKIKPESSLRLTNPFHACMIYEYNHAKNFEHVVGTYMTETRPCESKRTT
nr:Protein T22B11.1 [Haemonchus contortus]